MKTRTLALSFLLLLGACAPVQGRFDLVDPELLQRPRPADYPDDHAVVLRDSVRFESRWDPAVEPYLRVERHFVVAVLTEKGVEWAQDSVVMRGGTDLLSLTARVIDPDGAVRTLGAGEIHDEVLAEDRDSGDRIQRRVFRFPDVRPGSILELHYMTVSEGIAWQLWDRPLRDVPVKRYEVQIEGDARLKYAFKTYGTRIKPTLSTSLRDWRITWLAKDLPARSDEAFAPGWTLAEPWWNYRTTQVVFKGQGFDGVRTWKDAVAYRAKTIFLDGDPGLLRGFDGKVDVSGCEDVTCKVQRAWHQVRERTRWDGFSAWTETPVREAVVAGKADSFTRTVLLWHLLRKAGVEAYPAAAVIRGTRRLDIRWPATDAFNHHVVYVPAQDGLEGPLWVDPACDHCEPGTVPDWYEGGQAMVYSARAKLASAPVVKTSWNAVTGARPSPAATRYRSEWTLSPEGDLTGRAGAEHVGLSALYHERETRARSAADAESAAREAVTDRLETGRLVSFEKTTCDRAAGRCVEGVEMRLPGFGTVTGDRLLVPLTLLTHAWDQLNDERRRQDVMLHQDEVVDEVATIRLPQGWELSERPADAEISAPGFDAKVTVETNGGTVTVRRTLKLTSGRHPVKGYAQMRAAVRTFADLRQGMLVLRRVGGD